MTYKYFVFAQNRTLESSTVINREENYNTSGGFLDSNIVIFFTVILSSCLFLLFIRFILYIIENMCDSRNRSHNIISNANAIVVTNNIENVDVRVIEDVDEVVETRENILVATEVPFSRGFLLR
jgi:hypothetical protein